ncbi:MAG: UvrD-helicase domain-containing protein [Lachnospiraceae bacterium]|nr:UvrD-helicase domain-containing protein [Lachnospiraceae bacterium]
MEQIYNGLRAALDGKFDKLPPKASVVNEFDKDLAGKLKARRDAYKKDVEKIGSDFFFADPEELLQAHNTACAASRTLILLTREYLERLRPKKVETSTFGFDDIAHYALEILTEKDESGKLVASPRALVLRKRFDRIFIDEYQDSNDIQEEIANALAGPSSQVPYTFMVGDVKQSIYKFRMAKPELFMRRCELYRKNPSEGKVVVLDSNYRSFSCVLDSTNDVFYSAMRKEIGGITYDDEAALKPGTDAQKEAPCFKTELAVIEGGVESEAIYAASIAKRIMEETGSYKGIAVLIRTKTNISKYKSVFEEAGIPVVTAEKTGFLTTFEIRTMLDYLKIIDNPARDVPFVGALASPIGGFENEELARIRIEAGADILFCDAARKYAESGSDPAIREKLVRFFAIYDEIRGMNLCRDLGECISRIYDLTGFYAFCRALPGAEVRTANLDLLISYANDFENSSYSGLFSFVRYVDQLRSTEQDLDESAPADSENAVVLMTVHKSKGLEFPYVIVGGMNREMKELDAQESIILNSDFGIWPVAIDPERKIKTKTLDKQVVRKRMTLDMKGEELRLLYVAMTRARERLFLIGSDKSGRDVSLWEDEAEGCKGGNPYPYSYIASAKSWLDIVGPVALANPEHFEVKSVTADEIRSIDGSEISTEKSGSSETGNVSDEHELKARHIPFGNPGDEETETVNNDFERDPDNGSADDEQGRIADGIKSEDILEYYRNATCDVSDEEARDMIAQLEYSYPYEDLAKIPAKLSVSDIKKKHMDLNASPESTVAKDDKVTPVKNEAKFGKFTGGDYGTLLHRVLRFLPFDLSKEGIEAYLADLEERGVLSTEEKDAIRRDDIEGFIASPVYARLNAASQSKTLRREQPFITGIPACEIDSELYGDSQTLIPVQGVIDCLFEEDGMVTVLDYKTDHRDESWLKENYKPQLDLYMRAATAALGKPQGHELIYSFFLKKCIEIE